MCPFDPDALQRELANAEKAQSQWALSVLKHTDECLEYAAKTGQACCIASCADSRRVTIKQLEEINRGVEDLQAQVQRLLESRRRLTQCLLGPILDLLESLPPRRRKTLLTHDIRNRLWAVLFPEEEEDHETH